MKFKTLRFAYVVLLPLIIAAGCSQNPEELKKTLFEAVRSDDVATVKRCIAKKVNVNEPETPRGWGALHFAARGGDPEMVKTLLDAGADPNYVGTAPGQTGTVMSLKPVVLAQANIGVAASVRDNPALQIAPPDWEKGLRHPDSVGRYKQICALLEPVTKN